ncbi:MAG: coiled coil domain-containing protein [Calditrichia bacterium]
MEDQKSYLQKMADQLKQWDAEIDDMKEKADKAQDESSTELRNQIDELQAKKKAAEEKLKQLQEAGGGALNEMKAGLERSWKEFKGAFSNASGKFK